MATTVVKTVDTMQQATRYAAACERNNRDPQRIRFTPVPREDGRWDVVKSDRRF